MPNYDFKKPETFISGASVSSDYTSNPIEVLPAKRVGIELWWTTSDLVATVYVQASLTGDRYQNLPDENTTVSVAISGSSGSQIFDIDTEGFSKLQIFIDVTSGSATFNGVWQIKGLHYT